MKNVKGFTLSGAKGFSLLEILVVIAILGILAVTGIGTYTSSLGKSQDARRKSDLSTISKALESYYNDKGSYPGDLSVTNLCASDTNCYLKTTPKDPNGTDYCYVLGSTNGAAQSFQLYAKLERTDDPNIGSYSACSDTWTYGVASTNTTP